MGGKLAEMLRNASSPAAKTPLINKYKYGLCRRRFLQTLFGGPVFSFAPWFVHITQAVLWFLPLILSAPFIILDVLSLWNQYLLALVYSCVMGLIVLSEEIAVFIVRQSLEHQGSHQRSLQLDDENVTVNIPSFYSKESIGFIFTLKSKFSLVLHPLVSGLLSFMGCFILLPTILQEVLHVSLTVLVFVIGWLTLCSAQYSLSIRLPSEIAVYRPTDFLGLRSYYRPFYILALGSVFMLVRYNTC